VDQIRPTIAIHEAGHAVAFLRLFPTRSIHCVTIVPGPEYQGRRAAAFERLEPQHLVAEQLPQLLENYRIA